MSRPVPRDSNTTQGPLLLRRQLGRALKPPRDHPRDHSRDHSCHRTGPGSGGAGQAEDAAWQRPRRARIQRHQWLDPEQRLQWLDPELPGREWPAQKGRGGPQSGCRGAESGSSQRIRGQACANQRGQLGAAAPAWGAAAEAAASGRQRECIQGSDSTRAVVWAGVGMGHGSRKGRAAGQLHRRGCAWKRRFRRLARRKRRQHAAPHACSLPGAVPTCGPRPPRPRSAADFQRRRLRLVSPRGAGAFARRHAARRVVGARGPSRGKTGPPRFSMPGAPSFPSFRSPVTALRPRQAWRWRCPSSPWPRRGARWASCDRCVRLRPAGAGTRRVQLVRGEGLGVSN